MDVVREKVAAIATVHRQFVAIMEQEKCATCACFHDDVLAGVYQAITDLGVHNADPRLLAAAKDFSGWLEAAAHKTLHQ